MLTKSNLQHKQMTIVCKVIPTVCTDALDKLNFSEKDPADDEEAYEKAVKELAGVSFKSILHYA